MLAKAPSRRSSTRSPTSSNWFATNWIRCSPRPRIRATSASPPPRRQPNGPGWTACIKAELTSVIGKSLGTQTYLATISGGVILDRRRVEADDNCASETYEAI